MATIRPFRAYHYNPQLIDSLEDVIAPPYDVIDRSERGELAKKSPFNIVNIDLPVGDEDSDPYKNARLSLDDWVSKQILVRDDDDAIWVLEQSFIGPDGHRRTRTGFFAATQLEEYGSGVRPHERTHPGPKADRLALMRATEMNLSPIFALFSDEDGSSIELLNKCKSVSQSIHEFKSSDGTLNRLWRITDDETITTLQGSLLQSSLLIADGHHRYETARTYSNSIGGDGPHNYVLSLLVSLRDPGLSVFPTHRLLSNLNNDQLKRLDEAINRDWESTTISFDDLYSFADSADEGDRNQLPVRIAILDKQTKLPRLLTLTNTQLVKRFLGNYSNAYQHLDTAVLESLLLRNTLDFTDEQIDHQEGLTYARNTEEAVSQINDGRVDIAFFMRPTPVSTISAIASEAENMPPKTTYFYPKVPTGIVFNSLS